MRQPLLPSNGIGTSSAEKAGAALLKLGRSRGNLAALGGSHFSELLALKMKEGCGVSSSRSP